MNLAARMLVTGGVVAGALVLAACGTRCPSPPVDPQLRGAESRIGDGSLLGMGPDALLATLGPAAEEKSFIGWDQGYYLGPDSACVDGRWLVVRFDAEGKVGAVGLYHD